jgi:hypothetical protein
MGDDTRITIIVPEETKSEWKTYIDENPDADNMSHLLRMSVENYISDSDDDDGIQNEQLDNIEDAVERLQTDVAQTQDTLQVIKSQQFTENELYDISLRATEEIIASDVPSLEEIREISL